MDKKKRLISASIGSSAILERKISRGLYCFEYGLYVVETLSLQYHGGYSGNKLKRKTHFCLSVMRLNASDLLPLKWR